MAEKADKKHSADAHKAKAESAHVMLAAFTKSLNYHSFFSDEAAQAEVCMESSSFAGKQSST